MNHIIRSEGAGVGVAALLVGLYVLAVVAFFGVTLADTAYRAVLRDSLGAVDFAPVFSEIGDALLLAFWATVLAALVAIGSSWRLARARNLLIASIIVVMIMPPLLSLLGPLLAGSNPNLGPLLRIPGMAVAAALALLGFAGVFRAPEGRK